MLQDTTKCYKMLQDATKLDVYLLLKFKQMDILSKEKIKSLVTSCNNFPKTINKRIYIAYADYIKENDALGFKALFEDINSELINNGLKPKLIYKSFYTMILRGKLNKKISTNINRNFISTTTPSPSVLKKPMIQNNNYINLMQEIFEKYIIKYLDVPLELEDKICDEVPVYIRRSYFIGHDVDLETFLFKTKFKTALKSYNESGFENIEIFPNTF